MTSDRKCCWLKASGNSPSEFKIIGSQLENNATVFNIKGDVNTTAKISCQYAGRTLFWTWQNSKNHISLEENEYEHQQNFKLLTGSGEGLIKFGYGRSPSYSLKFLEGVLKKTKERSSNTEIKPGCLVQRAPTNETFLIYPGSHDNTFYFGLNHMVNSMRFEDKSLRCIRKDDFMHSLVKDISLKDEGILVDFQISLYCLCILIKHALEEFREKKIKQNALINIVLEKQAKFIEELQCHNDYHKPITKDRYELFLRKLNQKMMSEAYNIDPKSKKIIPIIFFQCIGRQKMLPIWLTVTKILHSVR